MKITVPYRLLGTGLLALLIVVGAAALFKPLTAKADGEVAKFADPALEWLVRQEIGILSGDIPLDEVQRIEKLVLSYEVFSKDYTIDPYEVGRVKQLQGLEQLTCLQELHLWDFHEIDTAQLAELKKLPHLKKLVVWGMQLDDLEAIGSLSQLQALQLSLVTAPNLDALRSLEQLESLWLESSAAVGDYTALGELKKLRSLELISASEKQPLDPEPLSRLTGLEELALLGYRLEQLEFLHTLGGLRSLDLRVAGVEDYRMLQALPALQRLILGWGDGYHHWR